MKKAAPVILILLIFLPFLLPAFSSGIFSSHDGETHILRLAEYIRVFMGGQVIPRWAPETNFGFGSPLFIFIYPLFAYLGAFLHWLGLGLIDSTKTILAASFLAAPIFFYLWIRRHVRQGVAIVGAILYGLAPYHFLDLYVRGAVGELMALTILPLVFCFLDRLQALPTKRNLVFAAFAYAFLILSHQGIALVFSPVIFFYALTGRSKSKSIAIISYFVLSLALSAFFWIPAIVEKKFLNPTLFDNWYLGHFPTLGQLIFSPWGFGPNVRETGGLSPQIGPLLIFFAAAGSFMLTRRIRQKRVVPWLVVFVSGVFLSLSASQPLWEKISFLRSFQFPWRFVALPYFAATVMGTIFLDHLNQKIITILVAIIAIFLAIPMSSVKGNVLRGDNYYFSYHGPLYQHGEGTTIWTAGEPTNPPANPVEIISGVGTISGLLRKNTVHTFQTVSREDAKVLDNTTYFPGWRAFVDGKETPIEFQDQHHPGLISFSVPNGNHQVEVKFTETKVRLLADVLSAFGILVSGILLII